MSKVKRLLASAALLGVAAALSGCSGINASHSVSPASFFLPGLIQHEAQPEPQPAGEAPVEQVALLTAPSR